MRTMLVVAVLSLLAGAARGGQTVMEGKLEVLHLHGLADPTRWGPSECTVEASKTLRAEGHPTLHLHIPVDHHGGEKNYPIGWPRMYLDLRKPDETGWGEFERFEFLIHATMSRPAPPRKVLNLQIHCPDRNNALNRNLEEIRLGEWARVSIPIRSIKDVEQVAKLGLNISESDYRHGDVLDFHIGAFRLVRAAEFGLASLKATTPVIYRDDARLTVEFETVGPPGKVARGLPLALYERDRLLHRETHPVARGVQTLVLDLRGLRLAVGRYSLVAFDEAPERRVAAEFRVVESPWETQK
ncbi:MAG: hypothetical protein FJ290_01505 [Planctomycetes bacterium]|nr:hypothetical protein [Planctomycetota bacterium]